jgi:WD40 repeat protein/energy-coupling factor transporter ATP-binding protein EcfA2
MKSSEDLTKGIVQILRNDGTVAGTGFIISRNLIATCAHVVLEARANPGDKVKVRFNNPDTTECSSFVIPERWRSPDKGDISILTFEEDLPSEVEVLLIGSSAGVNGHKVCTFGFPVVGDIKGIWGHGEVIGKVTERGTSLLQIDSNEITKGFSGAPLWDKSRQRVIGIVVGAIKKDLLDKLQNVAFAIPSEMIQSICPELKIRDICPYRGLFPFKEADENLFFGREKILREIQEQLRINPRFLAIVGSSGSGKSSLVFAGLLPRIQRGEIIGFENARIVTFRPNDVSPSDSACDSDPEESLREALEKSGIYIEKANLWEGIRSYLEKNPEIRLVIYADQFETLFSNLDSAKQVEFLQGIRSLLKSKLKVSFLLTVRADYYDFLQSSLLGEYLIGVIKGQANVMPMSEEEMREAIKKPAVIAGLEIETGLEDVIINDLENTKNSLPLLEFTLTKLWELRSNGKLTHETYDKIGGASGAIGQWANETYNSLSTEEKELARRIFTRLIRYGDADMPDSRRRLPLESLSGDNDEKAVHQLIKKLADAHILVTDCELSKGTETVEIIHDSLLIEWEQLKKWITEQRSFLTWRQRLEDRMDEWNRKEDEGNLLRGAPLVEAKNWLEKYELELNPHEIKYIKASSELVEKERAEKERIEKERTAEKERNKSRIIKGLTAFSIIILILAGFATYQWYEADNQKKIAEEKTKEARASYLNLQSQVLSQDIKTLDKSILLAIESFRVSRTLESDQLIRQGLLFIPYRAMLLNHDGSVFDVVFSPDGKYVATAGDDNTACIWDVTTGSQTHVLLHNDSVNSIVFSPDGKHIATASGCTACIWDVATGNQIRILNHDGWGVQDVVFSPDGKYVATASDDYATRIWDVSTGDQTLVLPHNDSVNSVVFSPDGRYVATASGYTVCVWDISTGDQTNVLLHDLVDFDAISSSVNSVVFGPDGKYVATTSSDNTVRVWDVSTGDQTLVLPHNDFVTSVVFSPDGKYLATASYDSMARIWDVSTGNQTLILSHDGLVSEVVFSRDGKYVATASDDGTARVWDVSTGKNIFVLPHDGSVSEVVFSRDGKYVATASDDGTARVWDVSIGDQTHLLNYDGQGIRDVVFSPDGKYVATASNDNTARLWDVSTGDQIHLLNHDGWVNSVVFSRDGKYVATASDDYTACIWDVSTGNKTRDLPHDYLVSDVVFSPDGKYVATASYSACIWDVSTGNKTHDLSYDGPVFDVVFSPDGKYVATASSSTVCIWDVATEYRTHVLNHNDSVTSVVFSPDGKYVATTSIVWDNMSYGTACLWDVSTGNQTYVLPHDGWVNSIVFSPDGKYVATASDDNTARIWDVATGNQIYVLNHAGWVRDVVFSSDGKYVATACYDNTARIWDVATGKGISVLPHDGLVDFVVFSPDAKYVALASYNTVRLCMSNTKDLITEASNRLTRNLNQEEWEQYMGDEPYHKTFPNLP